MDTIVRAEETKLTMAHSWSKQIIQHERAVKAAREAEKGSSE